jgi:hypothetical protein
VTSSTTAARCSVTTTVLQAGMKEIELEGRYYDQHGSHVSCQTHLH